MEALIYIVIFIIGTLFGSFFTLAVYRIPLGEDITHKRSFCPKCNHRLEFIDLIPLLSYVFLGGKCRYCKEKIRPRYFILEITSGLVFLLFALGVRLNIYNLENSKLVFLVYGFLYIATLFLIAGIDKENHIVCKSVLIFGLVVNIMYMIYLYIVKVNIYKYVIYLLIMLILFIIETIRAKKTHKENYTIRTLMLTFYLVIATNEMFVILSIILTLWLIAIKEMIMNKKDNKQEILIKNDNDQIPIAYYLCITNILVLLARNFIV